MQKNEMRPLAIGLIILGALIRVTQHWNFAPVAAISLFAGARLRGWRAYALPLVLMAITDPLLGGYSALTPLVSVRPRIRWPSAAPRSREACSSS